MSNITWYEGEGGIYSRMRHGKEVFYVRVWAPARRRFIYSKAGGTIDQARRKLHTIQADPEAFLKKREAKPARKPISMEALSDTFTKGYRSRGESGYYGHVAESWKEHFGKRDAAKVTRPMVEDYRDTLRREGYGDSTVRKYVGALGTMFRWAIGRGLVESNPAEGVRRPAEPDREVAVLSRDHETALLKVAERETRTAIRLFIESGMRLSEGLSLTWPQVDRDGGAILIHKSKTGKARAIPLNARLTAVLEDATRHVRSDFVLCDREGKPLDRFILARDVESALERAGIPKATGTMFNLFRHTCGSRLAERGVSMATVATILGNTEAVCMRHYIRFSPGHLKAAMAQLDRPAVAGSVAGSRNAIDSGAAASSEAVA
jgi:integrase